MNEASRPLLAAPLPRRRKKTKIPTAQVIQDWGISRKYGGFIAVLSSRSLESAEAGANYFKPIGQMHMQRQAEMNLGAASLTDRATSTAEC